jgi:anti-sigma B factor antagonist
MVFTPPPPRRTASGGPVAQLDLTGPVPVVVVDVPDWLDVSTAPAVEAVLDGLLQAGPRRVAVDLTGCPMADPFGLGMLARVRERAARTGTELWLVGVDRRVQRVLDILGLTDALPVRSRSDVAVRAS